MRRCACNAKSDVVLGGPLSPLAHFFPDRSTPELRRLQAELGARHSFREAARILETFLPCAKQMHTSVRNRLGKVAREICDSEQNEPLVPSSAEAAPALTVFLDGAHNRTAAFCLSGSFILIRGYNPRECPLYHFCGGFSAAISPAAVRPQPRGRNALSPIDAWGFIRNS